MAKHSKKLKNSVTTQVAFERAKKTYLGFLQARGKSLNTIKNYFSDLSSLGEFCEDTKISFQKLGSKDLEAYHERLLILGLKANSRRRKLITAKSFLRYLSGRMDVSTVGSDRLIPPQKVEKPPKLVSIEIVQSIISSQPSHEIGLRNKSLIGVLLDTGMLVTEVLTLKQEDCRFQLKSKLKTATLKIHGKRARSVKISATTAQNLYELSRHLPGNPYFFYGYSRSGPNAERLTSRGVEILFQAWAKEYAIKHGVKIHLHPRTMRHLYIVGCLLDGKTEAEIMKQLGLKTAYSFRVYRTMIESIKSSSQATYKSDTDSQAKAVHP